jgi:nucleotide-binding universal stress UspA family protein
MNYLIPFDFTDASKNAVKHAIRLAAVSSGNLYMLNIVKDKSEMKDNERKLNQYLIELPKYENISYSAHVVVGDIFTDIGKIAEYHGADFVVMGTHGVDMMQKIFGSNSVKIINSAEVPFIVIQENANETELKKIILPFSIETKSMQVLRFASQLSKTYQAEIHLVGRLHDDEFLKHKENANVILAKRYLLENNIDHHFEMMDVSKSKFLDAVVDYAQKENANMIACTYFSDALLPVFEKFVQHLINNEAKIPVLCLNAKSLSKINSTLSFMTV